MIVPLFTQNVIYTQNEKVVTKILTHIPLLSLRGQPAKKSSMENSFVSHVSLYAFAWTQLFLDPC